MTQVAAGDIEPLRDFCGTPPHFEENEGASHGVLTLDSRSRSAPRCNFAQRADPPLGGLDLRRPPRHDPLVWIDRRAQTFQAMSGRARSTRAIGDYGGAHSTQVDTVESS